METLLVAHEGHRNMPCVIVYLLVYFFGSAISTWWTVIVFSWCVSLSSICLLNAATLSTISHAFAWGIPAALTVAGIVGHQVEPDELISVCLPGAGFRDNSLLIFILVPDGIQLILGFLGYIVGLIAACMRNPTMAGGSNRTKLDVKTLKMLQSKVTLHGTMYLLLQVRWLSYYI